MRLLIKRRIFMSRLILLILLVSTLNTDLYASSGSDDANPVEPPAKRACHPDTYYSKDAAPLSDESEETGDTDPVYDPALTTEEHSIPPSSQGPIVEEHPILRRTRNHKYVTVFVELAGKHYMNGNIKKQELNVTIVLGTTVADFKQCLERMTGIQFLDQLLLNKDDYRRYRGLSTVKHLLTDDMNMWDYLTRVQASNSSTNLYLKRI
jgi:hypothetical protein